MMNEEQHKRLEKIRSDGNRRQKQNEMHIKLKAIIPWESFSFLSPSESIEFRETTEKWPTDKWENKLFIQTLITASETITEILKEFVKLNGGRKAYFFSSNYDFGLIEVSKELLINIWRDLIELDGDEIFCYLPNTPDFICIEKTEDVFVGHETKGKHWIYEVTFSNANLKKKLINTFSHH